MALNSLGVQRDDGVPGFPDPWLSRLAGKVALVVGGGQTPGETMGNGRAICRRFAAEGASVVVRDRCSSGRRRRSP